MINIPMSKLIELLIFQKHNIFMIIIYKIITYLLYVYCSFYLFYNLLGKVDKSYAHPKSKWDGGVEVNRVYINLVDCYHLLPA